MTHQHHQGKWSFLENLHKCIFFFFFFFHRFHADWCRNNWICTLSVLLLKRSEFDLWWSKSKVSVETDLNPQCRKAASPSLLTNVKLHWPWLLQRHSMLFVLMGQSQEVRIPFFTFVPNMLGNLCSVPKCCCSLLSSRRLLWCTNKEQQNDFVFHSNYQRRAMRNICRGTISSLCF